MTHSFVVVALLGVMACLSACGQSSEAPSSKTAETDSPAPPMHTIAVIPKSGRSLFWRSVEQGARQAAEELGVRVIWEPPLEANDRGQQIQLVEKFIAQNVDGIVLAPVDSKALRGPVGTASERGIPVVIFDSGLEAEAGQDFVSFVATDNRAAGRMAGRRLSEQLGRRGRVVLFRKLAGVASTTNREEGFLEAIADSPQIQVILDDRYAGPTFATAQNAALKMVDRLRTADGVFAPAGSATTGMLQALRQENLAGRVKFVGFDATAALMEALRRGEIDALIVQHSRRIGFLGVSTLVDHLNGVQVPARIDTGAVLVTLSNINDPEIRPLIR